MMNDAKENDAKAKLIFALDVDNLDAARSWVEKLQGQVGLFKIGKQLFTKCGPEVVNLVQDGGGDVFLDLKYHDIPNTVAMAGLEALRRQVAESVVRLFQSGFHSW